MTRAMEWDMPGRSGICGEVELVCTSKYVSGLVEQTIRFVSVIIINTRTHSC